MKRKQKESEEKKQEKICFPQRTKTAIVILHTKESSTARAAHYIALLTKLYTDV